MFNEMHVNVLHACLYLTCYFDLLYMCVQWTSKPTASAYS